MLCLSPLTATSFAFWPAANIKLHKYNDTIVSLHLEHRTSQGLRDTNVSFGSLKVAHKSLPYLDLGYNGTYLRFGQKENQYQTRMELELNPYFKTECYAFKTRNRLELRKTHGVTITSNRFRHRLTFSWNNPRLKPSFYHNYELFFDLKKDALVSMRLVPFGIKIPYKEVSFTLYYMIVKAKSTQHWHNKHILGACLNLSCF